MSIKPGVGLHDAAFKKAFLQDVLNIDCVEIRLTQNTDENPEEFVTAGVLQVSQKKGVYARLVVKRDNPNSFRPSAGIIRAFGTKPGTIYPDSHYYKLQAKDVAGNVWNCPVVDLGVSRREKADVLEFECDTLEMLVEDNSTQDSVHFVFSEDIDLPLSDALAKVQSIGGHEERGFSWQIHSHDGSVLTLYHFRGAKDVLPITSEVVAIGEPHEPTPVHFDARLLETLRFCSARFAFPVIQETTRSGKRSLILSAARPLNAGMFSPPLHSRGDLSRFFSLSGYYYRYACENGVGIEGTPLAPALGGVYDLAPVSPDTVYAQCSACPSGWVSRR